MSRVWIWNRRDCGRVIYTGVEHLNLGAVVVGMTRIKGLRRLWYGNLPDIEIEKGRVDNSLGSGT